MLFDFGKYVLDIDVDKTRTFYASTKRITSGCDCQGCRNYEAWAESLCEEPKDILRRMGVQLTKSPEVYVNCRNADGTLFYGGFYHLCGKIIRGNSPWKDISDVLRTFDEDAFISLTKEYQVAFTEDSVLVEGTFPTPVIQMEILANIPFVLSEKCAY